MLRILFSLAIVGALLVPTVNPALAKGGKAAKAAAKAAAKSKAKEKAKAKAKSKSKKFKKNQAKLQEEADNAREELKKEEEKAKWNEARIDRIATLADKKGDEALKKVAENLKTMEKERHDAIVAYYEPIAAKAPPKEEPAAAEE